MYDLNGSGSIFVYLLNETLLFLHQSLRLAMNTVIVDVIQNIIKMHENTMGFNHARNRSHIRADIISNKKVLKDMFKIVLLFSMVCLIFKAFPKASNHRIYSPDIWQNVDVFNVSEVNPLNRVLKIYLSPRNTTENMDHCSKLQVYSIKDDEEVDKVMDVKLTELSDYEVVEGGEAKFYVGDVHVLDSVKYRIKVFKTRNDETMRRLQELPKRAESETDENPREQGPDLSKSLNQSAEQATETHSNSTAGKVIEGQNQSQNISKDKLQIEQKQQDKQQEQHLKREEKTKEEEQQKKEEQQKEEQRKEEQRKEEQQKEEQRKEEQRKEEQRKEGQRKEEQRKEEQRKEEQRKEEERLKDQQTKRIKQMQKTNIVIEAKLKSNFETVLELVIRYISVLVIIYAAADNPYAPAGIWLIAAISTNPLLVMHVSYPNQISNIVDSFCASGPLLYAPFWLYFMHLKVKGHDSPQNVVFLIVKMTLGLSLYFSNVLRRLHFDVFIWQTLSAISVGVILGSYVWQGYLNLQSHHHRDIVLGIVSLVFLTNILIFQSISHDWNSLLTYIIMQIYAIYILYLLGVPKHKMKKSGQQVSQETQISEKESEELQAEKCMMKIEQ